MVTLFMFTKRNKDKMLILAHRKINVLYLWLVSLKYIYRLQSYGQSPITLGLPLVGRLISGRVVLESSTIVWDVKKLLNICVFIIHY